MIREILHTLACLSVLNGSTHSLHLYTSDNVDTSSSATNNENHNSQNPDGKAIVHKADAMASSTSTKISGSRRKGGGGGDGDPTDFADITQLERERLMLLAAGGNRNHPIIAGSIHMNAADNVVAGRSNGHQHGVSFIPFKSRRYHFDGIKIPDDRLNDKNGYYYDAGIEHMFPIPEHFDVIAPHQHQRWITEGGDSSLSHSSGSDSNVVDLPNYPIIGDFTDGSNGNGFYDNNAVDYRHQQAPRALQDLFGSEHPRQIMHIDDMFAFTNPKFDIRIQQQKMQPQNLHQLQQLQDNELQNQKSRIIPHGHLNNQAVASLSSSTLLSPATFPFSSSSSLPIVSKKQLLSSSSLSSSLADANTYTDAKGNKKYHQQRQQQQQILQQPNNKRSGGIGNGGGGGGSSGQPPTHSIASQLMLRTSRGQRQYDVPQIECPPSVDGMQRFACPTPDLQGRYRCVDDHVLCDGFIDCPEGEDEDRRFCMFHKASNAREDILADALLRWARGR